MNKIENKNRAFEKEAIKFFITIGRMLRLVNLTGVKMRSFERKLPEHTGGQTRETLDFTKKKYQAGEITADEKLRLDNESIRNNSLANLNGFETYVEETPGEWDKYVTASKKK